MKTWKTIASHTSEYNNPIKLSKGEIVKLGDLAPEPNWKDWIWAKNKKHQGGWVPIQIIKKSEDNKEGIILEDYDAKELTMQINEIVEKIKSLNGWSWVRRKSNNEQGWIPDENLIVYTDK